MLWIAFIVVVSTASATSNDTEFIGALDPHSFAYGNQPSNSNHGNRILIGETQQQHLRKKYIPI